MPEDEETTTPSGPTGARPTATLLGLLVATNPTVRRESVAAYSASNAAILLPAQLTPEQEDDAIMRTIPTRKPRSATAHGSIRRRRRPCSASGPRRGSNSATSGRQPPTSPNGG